MESPVLSFCLDVPILEHEVFLKGKSVRREGNHGHIPKHLGMGGNKDYLERLTRGAFCVSHVGEKGINKQKIDTVPTWPRFVAI